MAGLIDFSPINDYGKYLREQDPTDIPTRTARMELVQAQLADYLRGQQEGETARKLYQSIPTEETVQVPYNEPDEGYVAPGTTSSVTRKVPLYEGLQRVLPEMMKVSPEQAVKTMALSETARKVDQQNSVMTRLGEVVNVLKGVKGNRQLQAQIIEAAKQDPQYRDVIGNFDANDLMNGNEGEIGAIIRHPETKKAVGMLVEDGTGKFHTFRFDQGMTEAQSTARELRSRDLDLKEKMGTDMLLKGDKEYIEATTKELPKLKAEANTASNSLTQIDKALKMVATGKVTGKGGQLKAFIAPYAEMFGVDTAKLSDAQAYQLFTRVITGPMRLDLVGGAQISDYEQKLWNMLSGGGGVSRAAARELLTYYKSVATSKINNYNNTVDSLSKVYPRSKEIYQRIGSSSQPKTSSGNTGMLSGNSITVNGQQYQVGADGTFTMNGKRYRVNQ